jgi:hypothetical protein
VPDGTVLTARSSDSLTEGAVHHVAGRNWHVFPCDPESKRPAIKQWEQQATIDEQQIHQWWPEYSRKNIGIAAGPSGLLVAWLVRRPHRPSRPVGETDARKPPRPSPSGQRSRSRPGPLVQRRSWLSIQFLGVPNRAPYWVGLAVWVASAVVLVAYPRVEVLLARSVYRLRPPYGLETQRLGPAWWAVCTAAGVNPDHYRVWAHEGPSLEAEASGVK